MRAFRAFRSRRIGARAFICVMDTTLSRVGLVEHVHVVEWSRARASSDRPAVGLDLAHGPSPTARAAWMSSHVCAQLA